jgi:diguanylate cyclase (GGDEF)-like protein
MKAVSREYDYVARMGGDEFVIVAPGLTPKAAEEKAEHLLSLAREAGRQVCGNDFLSVSIGCAFYPENGSDAEQLLTEADRRMYVIKQDQHQRVGKPVNRRDSPVVVN